MRTRIIRSADIYHLISHVGLDALMDQMIHQLRQALLAYDESDHELPIRDGFNYTEPFPGLVEWMPIMKKAHSATIKVVGYHPDNPERRGLPSVLSTIGIYDIDSGHLKGLGDATFLTALRTGAASAIASECLAKKSSSVVGMIGVGAQSVTQLHALGRLFPIEKILINDIDPNAEASFVTRIKALIPATVEIRAVPVELLVQSADILCTSTSIGVGEGPLFEDREVRPWLHVNAVGADFPGKTELPLNLLKRSLVVPDFARQAMKEGECQRLDAGDIGPDLASVVQGEIDIDDIQQRLTVFDSTGYALEDQVAIRMLLDYCDELDLGVDVQLETATGDPRNPYDLGEQSANKEARIQEA